jgi:hypothetical protein
MTLIASFEIDHTPILVGDLLITRPASPSTPAQPTSTPLVHNPNSLIGQQSRSVSALCQKVALLHDHLCLAWAGSWLHAKSFAEHIRSFASGKSTLDYEELRSVIMGYPRKELENHIDFVLYSRHGGGWGNFSNLKPFELDGFDQVRVAGTGTEHFIQVIQNFSNAAIVGNRDRYNTHAMKLLEYSGLASAQQGFGSVGLLDWWGGGFEVVVFQDGRMRKLGPICWLFWVCTELGERQYQLELQNSFMYQFYRGDTAYFWVDADSTETNRFHAVDPPFGTSAASFDRPGEINTEITLNLLRRHFANGNIWDGCFIDQTGRGEIPDLQIRKDDAEVSVLIKDEFLRKMLGSMILPRGSNVLVKAWNVDIPCQLA